MGAREGAELVCKVLKVQEVVRGGARGPRLGASSPTAMLRSPTTNSKLWPPFQGAREASWPTEDKQRHLSDSLVSCIGDSSVLNPVACVYMTLTPDLQFQGWAQVVRLSLSLLLLLLIFYFLYYGCKWPFSLQKSEIRKYRLNGAFPLE